MRPPLRKSLLLSLSLLAAATLAPAIAEVGSPVTGDYVYPPQTGAEELQKFDPDHRLLNDGKSGPTGEFGVWGQWDVKTFVVDWTFPEAMEISAVEVVINHPTPDSPQSHPDRMALYVEEGTEFSNTPVAVVEIPFEEGGNQTATLSLPEPIVARRLRTEFQTDHHQIALSEITFDARPAGNRPATTVPKRSSAAPAAPEVVVLPAPRLPVRPLAKVPFFGVCGHLLHTDYFFPGKSVNGQPAVPQFSSYWNLEYTLPLVQAGGFQAVREALYQPFFASDAKAREMNGRSRKENRARVEDALRQYADAGVSVLLAPMFGQADDPELPEFAAWVGALAKQFPNVLGVELSNEPNLKGFWQGTPAEFVRAAGAFANGVREVAPEARIVAGSFAGWGGAWEHEDLKELTKGPREIARVWAEKAFDLGLLKFAGAVSAHPYRGPSAPEGGDVIEDRRDPDGFEKEVRSWLALARSRTPEETPLPFFITEIGYSVSGEGYSKVASEERQADYLSRQMVLALDLRLRGVPIEGIFWYDLKQDEVDYHYEANFGLVSKNTGRLRPAFFAYQRIIAAFPDVTALRAAELPRDFRVWPEKIKSFAWSKGRSYVVGFWRMNQLQERDEDFGTELIVSLPEGFSPVAVELNDLHENGARRIGFSADASGRLAIPLQVTARAAWIEIIGRDEAVSLTPSSASRSVALATPAASASTPF